MAIPKGDINLFRNVPLSANYEHTIDFKNKDEQFSYFFGFLKNQLTNYSYIRKEREYIAVELPLSALDDVNYLSFRSDDGERLYYAFVTNKTYINPTTSHIYFDIDVLQTYMFDYEWRASYIEQAHVDRWTVEHKPIYSKTDEGLSYGNEYVVESAFRIEQEAVKWALVCMKDFSGLGATWDISQTGMYPVSSPYPLFLLPISYQIEPPVLSFYCESKPIGEDSPGIVGGFNHFVSYMLRSGIGEYIQSITILPYNPLIASDIVMGNQYMFSFKSDVGFATVNFDNAGFRFIALLNIDNIGFDGKRVLARTDWNNGLTASLPTEKQWSEIKANPRKTKRDKRFESKLLCAPYRYNLLTDWRNESIIYKNEYMTSDKIEINYSFALSPTSPFRYWVKDYRKDPEGRGTSLSQPLAVEMPIISDAYYTYMLQNKNTIQANLTNSIVNAGAGVVSGVIAGASGGVAGMITGGVTSAVSGALNVQAQIRSENAKQGDINTRPDSVISSADGMFNILDKNIDITFYRMQICCENEEIIAEIFNMSGYKVNRVDVPNTRSRARFNYIKTVGANIVGSFNHDDLSKIKSIYNNGVTIWHYSETDFYPLDYSYENIEVNLL